MDLSVIEDVPAWTLTDDGWQRADALLAHLGEALDSGDQPEIARLVTALILTGPRRISRGVNESMDRPQRRPASAHTRDLVNRLVDRIGREKPESGPQDRADGAQDPTR